MSELGLTGLKSNYWQDLPPSGGFSRESLPCLFQLLEMPTFLGLRPFLDRSYLLFPHHIFFSDSDSPSYQEVYDYPGPTQIIWNHLPTQDPPLNHSCKSSFCTGGDLATGSGDGRMDVFAGTARHLACYVL